jgi:hypothetical protein
MATSVRLSDRAAQRSRAGHPQRRPARTSRHKAEHEAPEWQAAAQALLLVAERGGPTMLARIGIMRALNRHVERVFVPSGKKHHWGRRKLARDQ